MTYNRPLPTLRELKKLAEWSGPFPLKSYQMVICAERYGFDDDIVWFLQLFPHNRIFRNRDDFLLRCRQLEARIRPEKKANRSVATIQLPFMFVSLWVASFRHQKHSLKV